MQSIPLRLEAETCLDVLDDLIKTAKGPIVELEIFSAEHNYYITLNEFADLIHKTMSLGVETLTLTRLSSDLRIIMLLSSDEDDRRIPRQLPSSKLQSLTLIGCDDFQGFIDYILTACKSLTKITAHNCLMSREEQESFITCLEGNYALMEVKFTRYESPEYAALRIPPSILIAEEFTGFVGEIAPSTRRNRVIDENCQKAIATIFEMQKSDAGPNYFKFIGGDCTRLIGGLVLDTKHDPLWFMDSELN